MLRINKIFRKNKNKKNADIFNNYKIELKNPIQTLNLHKGNVLFPTLLNDGRLVSGAGDNLIIYNKETFKPDLIINEHKGGIYFICPSISGILSLSSQDKTIKLFNIIGNEYNILQTLDYHSNAVYEIVELKKVSSFMFK